LAALLDVEELDLVPVVLARELEVLGEDQVDALVTVDDLRLVDLPVLQELEALRGVDPLESSPAGQQESQGDEDEDQQDPPERPARGLLDGCAALGGVCHVASQKAVLRAAAGFGLGGG